MFSPRSAVCVVCNLLHPKLSCEKAQRLQRYNQKLLSKWRKKKHNRYREADQ